MTDHRDSGDRHDHQARKPSPMNLENVRLLDQFQTCRATLVEALARHDATREALADFRVECRRQQELSVFGERLLAYVGLLKNSAGGGVPKVAIQEFFDSLELLVDRWVEWSLAERLTALSTLDPYAPMLGFLVARLRGQRTLTSEIMNAFQALEDQRSCIIATNETLAHYWAGRAFRSSWVQNLTLSYDELFAAAWAAMLLAIDRYDSTRAGFSTYASWWMRQQIQDWVSRARPIQIPNYLNEFLVRYLRAVREFRTEQQCDPPDDHLLAVVNCSPEQLGQLRRLNAVLSPERLDGPLCRGGDDEGDGRTLYDTQADIRASVVMILGDWGSERDILRILELLPERQADIIRRRFGFGRDGEVQTLENIAEEFGGLTRERIRQIEVKGMRKLALLLGYARAVRPAELDYLSLAEFLLVSPLPHRVPPCFCKHRRWVDLEECPLCRLHYQKRLRILQRKLARLPQSTQDLWEQLQSVVRRVSTPGARFLLGVRPEAQALLPEDDNDVQQLIVAGLLFAAGGCLFIYNPWHPEQKKAWERVAEVVQQGVATWGALRLLKNSQSVS